jgi:hypothetical protein
MENLNHLPYMNWSDWINNLSRFRYAVHLMPTQAAGTFALNCAYHGIPCIGYEGLDTQSQLHPHCTIKYGNLSHAKEIVMRLAKNNDFYEQCSRESKMKYESLFSENTYVKNMNKQIQSIL